MRIFIAIIGLLLTAGFIGWSVTKEKLIPALLGVATAIIFFLITISIVIVPTGYMGIKSRYQQIEGDPLKPGTYFTMPFINQVDKINCKQQERTFEDKVWAESSERTAVYFENIVVNYQINPEYAVWIWQNIEEWDNNLLKRTSVESGIKSASVQFNDTEVTNRQKIEKAAKEYLQAALDEKYQAPVITVLSVNIGNIDFSDEYNEAIEKKAQAKIAAETAAYEQQRRLTEAETDAQEATIKAQGQADAKIIAAEAEATANEKIANSLTPELIKLKIIDKWDGKLPVITGDSTPIINTESLFTEEGE